MCVCVCVCVCVCFVCVCLCAVYVCVWAARKPFHDLGYKMGDGYVAFWKHAHRTEPIVVYSVILAAMGKSSIPLELVFQGFRHS